jgi:PEP-CTERM motif
LEGAGGTILLAERSSSASAGISSPAGIIQTEALVKLRFASLTSLCLALAAVPAWADYDNGPINGTTDAWTINFGYIVSDTYVSDGSDLNAFIFGVWEFPGDTMSSVDWSITSGENSGTVYGSGTASGSSLTDRFISTNQYGYNIDLITVTGLSVPQVSGATYWLNLQNAAVPSGDPVYWDENSGQGCSGSGCPSSASESAVGTIASEAFTIGGCGAGNNNLPDCGPPTPEPSSILLFGSGIPGLAGVLRSRRRL